MTDLINHLFFYSEDHCVPQCLETPEYNRTVHDLEQDWAGFRTSLTAEQDRRLEDLLSRQFTAKFAEEQAVFRSALSIGITLGRL
jgi:hypothetical protein